MIFTNEGFSFNTIIENINLALRRTDLTLAELLGIYSLIEVQILKSPKNKALLNGRRSQVERRILSARSAPKAPSLTAQQLIESFYEIM